ncbi:MAG TPA: spore coat protein [Peptococcaceae bacterium]|nr:spore coat protein [Peptococcaceae bacterium]
MRTLNLVTENIKELQVPDDRETALDFLQSVKSGIIMYATALTETSTSSARTVLTRHLKDTLALHNELITMLQNKNWLPNMDNQQNYQQENTEAPTPSPRMAPPRINF